MANSVYVLNAICIVTYSTGKPPSRISFAVPPEASSLILCFTSPLERSSNPVLSYTDRIAVQHISKRHSTQMVEGTLTDLLGTIGCHLGPAGDSITLYNVSPGCRRLK